MSHANAGTSVEMVRVTTEDTRTEGREGCVLVIIECETRRRQRLKTAGGASAGQRVQSKADHDAPGWLATCWRW